METKKMCEGVEAPPGSAVVLAGDIGGTKVRLGVFARDDAVGPRLLTEATFSSRNAESLEEIIRRMLSRHPWSISRACFGVAGPVSGDACRLVNLPWDLSAERIRAGFGWESVRLINDLVATALSVPHLVATDVSALKIGTWLPGGTIGLVAPGTGLGQALILPREGSFRIVASEGGHADFAPTDDAEIDLWRFLNRRFGHVSIERVVSGPGLVHIYSWLKDQGGWIEAEAVHRAMATGDLAQVISENAGDGKDSLCTEALARFCRILGAVAGNLALTGMTTGGIYLWGGIPHKIRRFLKSSAFVSAFVDKGRLAPFLEKIPVWVIVNDQVALYGAARCALYGNGAL